RTASFDNDHPAPASPTFVASEMVDLSVTGFTNAQDAQGHGMLYMQAHSKDGTNFVLTCYTAAQSTCRSMQNGDYTAEILQLGDPDYSYSLRQGGTDIVRVKVQDAQDHLQRTLMFTMSKRLRGKLLLTVAESIPGARDITAIGFPAPGVRVR